MKNIQEIEEQLNTKFRHKLYSSKRLYSNRRAMKKMIRRHEENIAAKIALLVLKSKTEIAISESIPYLEHEFEWFFTWRLHIGNFPEAIWCDGVKDLKIIPKSNWICDIQARAWIGPTSDVSRTYLCDLKGQLMLNQRLNKLKRYKFCFVYKEKMCITRKGRNILI